MLIKVKLKTYIKNMINKNKFKHLSKEEKEKMIVKGIYCHDENGTCPFWDMDSELPYQANGYCHYLEKGDFEIDSEMEVADWHTNKILTKQERNELPFLMSLLWDQCKECNINDDDEDF